MNDMQLPLSIDGRWVGEVTVAEGTYAVDLTLEDRGNGFLDGDGTIEVEGEVLSFTLESGTYVHPLVTMELRFDRPPLGKLDATVSVERDEMQGTMNGPNFSGPVALSLRRP